MGKSSGATFSKIQVDIASKCCQMVKNDRILADERPFQHFLAILAHFMPIYTRIFENGTARLRCPSGVSRALFCRSETYLQSGQYKNYECQQSFGFFRALCREHSLLFSETISKVWQYKKAHESPAKTQFPCRCGENGQISQEPSLFKNPGRYCRQMLPDGPKNDRILR